MVRATFVACSPAATGAFGATRCSTTTSRRPERSRSRRRAASCCDARALPADHLLDERFPIFFNDVQFARRLANEGKSLWVLPEAVVVHEAHATTKKLGERDSQAAVHRVSCADVVRDRELR